MQGGASREKKGAGSKKITRWVRKGLKTRGPNISDLGH